MKTLRVWAISMFSLESDADTKLVISHLVGKRDAESAYYFMQDLQERLATRESLRTTPAMTANLTDHLWTLEELLSQI